MDLHQKIGQKMIIGIGGTTLSQNDIERIKKYKYGGVILFKYNLVSKLQTTALCKEIQKTIMQVTGSPAFISIDQEGGVVTRLPDDMTNVPSAMALSATNKSENAYTAANITAKELKAVGVNLNFMPVLDVNSNADNPVIGVRSYGNTVKRVNDYAMQAIRGHEDEKLMCCGKHFPGHGDTDTDSHLTLPMVNKSYEELEKMEFAPFKEAIANKIPAIMTTHILFPQIEPEKLPATMSRKILTGILKEKMNFEGLIFSDGMEMNAVKEFYGTPEGCVLAVKAGVDIVTVCHSAELIDNTATALLKAYEDGTLDMAELSASVKKIQKYKAMYIHENSLDLAVPGCEEHKKINSSLMRQAITNIPSSVKEMPKLGENPLFAGCLAYRSTIASALPDSSENFANFLATKFSASEVLFSTNPQKDEIDKVLEKAKTASCIIIGTYNGHLNKGQIALVNNLSLLNIPTVAIALRNPYDLYEMPENIYKIAAFEYNKNSFEALIDVINGTKQPTGRLSE